MKIYSELLLLVITAITVTSRAGDIIFEQVQPIIYLRTPAKVSLGVAEYDINFAYTNPCSIFKQNIQAHSPNRELSRDQSGSLKAFTRNCDGLYVLEWANEIKQLLKVNLPRTPLETRTPPSKPDYREPRIKRSASNFSWLDESDAKREIISMAINELLLAGKYAQILNWAIFVSDPGLFHEVMKTPMFKQIGDDPTDLRKIIRLNKEEADLIFSTDDVLLREKAWHNATVRHFEDKTLLAEKQIQQSMKGKIGYDFVEYITSHKEMKPFAYRRGNETILATEKALKSTIGIRQSIVDGIRNFTFLSHLNDLKALKRRCPLMGELNSLRRKLEKRGSISRETVNDIESFTLYEKIRYYFVPFFRVSEMEERIIKEFDGGLTMISRERREIPTTDAYAPKTSTKPPPATDWDFSIWDVYNESSWDNFEWFNHSEVPSWAMNACAHESAVTTTTRKYAEKLQRLRRRIEKLTPNELFLLKLSNRPERLTRREVSEEWHWYSYVAVAFAMWSYPVVCDAERQYYFEALIEEHKAEIRKILNQPALETFMGANSRAHAEPPNNTELTTEVVDSKLTTPLFQGDWASPHLPVLKRSLDHKVKSKRKRQISEFESKFADTESVANQTLVNPFGRIYPLDIIRKQYRPMRGFLRDLVTEIVKQNIGMLTGNIVTNLITTVIEVINPLSN